MQELDALVAERVMGWEPTRSGYYLWRLPDGSRRARPAFSTDIAEAFRVVAQMLKMGHDFGLRAVATGKFYAFFSASKAEGETASEAICIAALGAVYVEWPQREMHREAK